MKKLLIFALAAVGLFACDKGPEYKASPSSMNLIEGATQKIVITPEPNADYPVTFSSADASIATVSTDGTVTAVGAGTTKVAVKCDKTKFNYEVTVVVSAVNYAFSPASKTMMEKETFQLTILPTPPAGAFEFSSSDPSVATVSATGLVTAVKKGNANITATYADKNVTISAAITVNQVEYKLNYSNHVLWVLDTFNLKITPTPPANSFVFSSSDNAIATVDANGLVTAVAEGNVVVKAKSDAEDIELTCNIEIRPNTSSFTLPVFDWTLDTNEIKDAETHYHFSSLENATFYVPTFICLDADSISHSHTQYYYDKKQMGTIAFSIAYIWGEEDVYANTLNYFIKEWDFFGFQESSSSNIFISKDGKVAVWISNTPNENGQIDLQFQDYTIMKSKGSLPEKLSRKNAAFTDIQNKMPKELYNRNTSKAIVRI